MKLSKSQEAELIKVYDTWLNSYLNGDVKTYDSFLDDSYHFIGSTNNEEFLNRNEATKFFGKTADQFAGKTDIKNRIRTVEYFDGLVFITELFDAWFLIGSEWNYYGRFRFSSILKNKKDGWRFIYQHFSMPDSKAQEGETLGAEQISKENQELRDAIKRRTVELEEKNRQLEIEASLERVRARTMAMQQSHELSDVATVLFKELNELVENLWTCGFVLCEKDRPEDEWWLSTEEGFVPPLFLPNVGDVTHHNIYEAWNNGASYHTEQLEGDALQEHYDWLMTIPLAKAFFDDMLASGLEMPSWQKLHCAYFSYGYLVMITQVPCPEETIFKRFAKVFDQTYTRFLDLQKAEAQVREAKIEAALEKVRARSMAMHKADELGDTAMMLFAQITELGIPLRSCGFLIMDEEKQVMEDWSANIDEHGNSAMVTGTLAYDQHALLKNVVETWRRGDPYIIAETHGADLQKYYEAVTTKESTTKEIESKVLAKATSEYTNSFYFEYGMMYVLTPEPISEHEINMLMRFAGVFKLTYRRFLDLQKAEAQVKQAKIESALERVRSQSLSMHRSKDMQQVADAIFNELQNLGLKMSAVGMLGQIKENSDYEVWMGGSGYSEPLLIPFTDSTQVQRDYNVIMKERPAIFARTYSGAVKKEYIDFLMGSNTFPENLAKEMRESDAFSTSISFSKNSGIQIARYSGEAYDHEENEILKNFAQVFEQAYIRFLDLQKAEAQAREAEIELALERVRARTMAMQSSDELADVATVLFQQVKELGIPQWTCGFNIWEIGDKEFTFYPGGPDGEILPSCQVPLFEHPIFAQFDESRRRGDELLVYEKKGKMGADHYKYMHSLPGIGDMLQGMLDMGLEFPEFQIDHLANFAYGNLIFITYEPFPEMHNVFIRFAKVFEQTYTRFLDLQKAEAQAREAQIQLSLERVRARSLAMKSSDELHEVLSVLFRQFDILGIQPVNVFLSLFDREDRTTTYRASGKSGKRIPGKQVVGIDSLEAWTVLFDKWENDSSDSVEVIYYPKEIVPEIFELFKETFSAMPREDRMTVDDFPNGGYSILGYTPFGYLGYDHTRKATEEEKDILTRFCTEFGRIYQRFLDIQKAEAQAREAQIETALERVRSRSLAMHTTGELQEVTKVVAELLQELGVVLDPQGVQICTYPPDSKDVIHWTYAPDEERSIPYFMPYFKNQIWDEAWRSKNSGASFFSKTFPVAVKNRFLRTIFTREDSDYRLLPQEFKDWLLASKKYTLSFAWAQNSALLIPNNDGLSPDKEQQQVLIRFAKVFEQAYIRFLDLQKAEAQALEAKIEAALERVRSRSMAMYKSEEIGDVAFVLFEQLKSLGGELWGTGFGFCQKDSDVDEFWFANKNGIMPHIKIPNTKDPSHKKMYEGWKENLEAFSIAKGGKELREHYKYMLTVPDASPIFQEILDSGIQFPKWQKWHAAYFKFGYLLVITTEIYENEEIFKRFAKVFEQAYTRFLDLQKAEAQARESQIEAALERLRAQSMAMHKTEELSDVVKSLFEELKPFGFAKSGCELILVDEKNELLQFWNSNPVVNKIQESFNIPKSIHPFFQKQWKAWKNQVPRLTITMKGEEKKTFDQLIFTRTDFKHLPEDVKKFISHHGVDVFSLAIMKHGLLEVVDAEPISEDMFTVLERFAKVFEQSYTRFLDLQKAESQAREAQIEWALERVRSRTMAMQKSEELKEVIQVVYEQFLQLNINIEHAGFIIDYKARDDMHIWLADRHEIQSEITFPYFDCAYWNSFKEAKEKGLDFFVTHLTFEEKNKFYKDLFDLIPGVPEESVESYLSYPGLAGSTVLLDNVGLYIENFAGIPYSEEENKTLMRFGKVFQQTYTRFLDLQKAESQARQAEINLAVERVRAKALAMHKSESIMEVVAKLKDEVMNLNIPGVVAATIFLSEGDDKIRMWDLSSIEKLEEGYEVPLDIIFTLKKKDPHLYVKRVWENPGNYFVEIQDEKGFKRILAWLREHHKNEVADEVEAYIESAQLKRLYHAAKKLNNGKLCIDLLDPPLDEMESILTKMGAAFDLAYKRFEDLQKAEAQAREAQIEAALERVRSLTMGMHNSQDVGATVGAMFDELLKLGIEKSVRCGIGILDQNKPMELWTASSNRDGEVVLNIGFLDMSIHPLLKGLVNAWQKKETNFTYELKGKDVLKYFTALNEAPDYLFHADLESLPKKTIHNSFLFSEGTLYAFSPQPLTEEEEQIFKRFSGVFAQTYTRYLDLLKAEAQAREAEIEAALERVRSQTMAMHNSQDVAKTVVTFFDEVMKLGLNKSIRCGIGILEDREKMETWSATSYPNGDVDLQVGRLDMKRHPLIKGLEAAWKNKEDGYSGKLIGEDVVRYYEQLIEEPDYPFHVDLENLADIEYHRSFFFSSGIIFTFTKTPLSEEAAAVLKRFAGVFGQTYRRFLDLQKAEAQAKEAQIEAALEKVRSRTMAMQASSELQEAANVLFLEIQALGIKAWSAGYNILSDDKTTSTCWMSSEGELQDPFPLYYTEEASFIEMGTFLKSQDDFFVQELQGKELERHYDYMKSLPELKDTFKHIQDAGLSLPTYQVNHLCKFNQGYLLFITYEAVPYAHDIFKRFTKVFEQTYTRFLDLKKAENQSKEAQIELALERVRASTMAMHKSEQLAGTAEVLFDQFDLLGIIPDRISIAIFNEKKRIFELWATDQNGTFVNHAHDFSIDEPTCMAKTYQAWKEGKETFVVDLKGADLKRWIRFVKEDAKMELDESKFEGRRVQHCAFFSQGYLLLSSHLPIKDEMLQLLLRFAKVFQQTYTRFLDLQKAETQAREAIKRASVDRVRAEIASMRTTTDLNRITPLVWNELTTLNVPFIRCGVFIMDEEQQQVQTHLSTPDGKAIASFNLPFENTEPLTELLPYWRKNEIYKDHWDESAFIESTRILMQRGAIASSETYVTEKQPTNLYLHFLPFLQGMLYVGSEVSLSEDELNLVQNLAEAFSTAYSRYEDFNKLELANKKIEKTLVDLKQTQTQLIQSEKMASLGELTAGIAHEIQNPLNFVNNFSEVSHELMKEMLEELEKGDLDEAREISHDIEQNLEKINHHGKRASDIVKGMLEHSRKGDGKKELTNINKLADEYLRLAYHGLRAKDKSFNADFSEDFDQDLPLIQAIPQDMGRVLLNLISNAFYAVSAKDKQGLEGYKPTVVVSTKKVNDLIEIKVKDNGSGVSKSIRDKIFQPFFTTKPTGQGTGLGLSMSYDIVTKGHGGSLEVNSTEGEGSEFIINLNI